MSCLSPTDLFIGRHTNDVYYKLLKKYGDIFTVWNGMSPAIIICDLNILKKIFFQKNVSGRQELHFFDFLSNEKQSGVLFDQFGLRWECLRKVSHSAVK